MVAVLIIWEVVGPQDLVIKELKHEVKIPLLDMNHNIRFPTICHFFKMKTQTSLCSLLLSLETLNGVQSVAYQADFRLCWSHIPHCWKSHALAHIVILLSITVRLFS